MIRETFAAVLGAQPMATGDAVIVLTGDGLTRAPTAAELVRRGFAPRIVVSGGVNDPPYATYAPALRRALIEDGIDPLSIITEAYSQNTAESAREVVALAEHHGWRQLLLVTSAYHMPRAFLSFVHVLNDVGLAGAIRVVPVRVTQPWWEIPDGLTRARWQLVADEARKVTTYQKAGDVASYEDGLAYLKAWEGR